MKKTLLLTVMAGFLCTVHAQTGLDSIRVQKYKTHQAMVGQMLAQQTATRTGAKPTGTEYRVIAQTAGAIGNIPDSTAFSYSGNRGSRYNYDDPSLRYAEVFENAYSPIPVVPYGPNTQSLQYALNPMDMLADTVRYFSGSFTPFRTANYRPDNKISMSTAYVETQFTRIVNQYNGQGHLSTSYTLESINSGASYDSTYKRTFTYNTAFTRVATDTVYFRPGPAAPFQLSNTLHYYYNTANKLDSLITYGTPADPILLTSVLKFYYYPDGSLQRVTCLDNSIPGFNINTTDSMGYTPGSHYATYRESLMTMSDGTQTMTSGNRWVKYPGSGGLPDSIQTYRYDDPVIGWEMSDKVKYSYTSFGLPDSLLINRYDNTPAGKIRFYYEPYETTVSVQPVETDRTLSVSPNPFNDFIRLDNIVLKPGSIASLLDIGGREVYSIKLKPGDNMLRVPGLKSGNYILQIKDGNGKYRSCKVVKQ